MRRSEAIGVVIVGTAILSGLVWQLVSIEAAKTVAAAGVALTLVASVVVGAASLRAWARLRGGDAVAPRAVEAGPVELRGVARPLAETLSAPRTDDSVESLAYEHVVKVQDQETEERWRTVTDERESVPFVVAGEGGGEVVVDPDGAELVLEPSVEQRSSDRKVTVSRVDAGEEVYVTGEATPAYDLDIRTDGREFAIRAPESRLPEWLRWLRGFPFLVSDASEAAAQRQLLLVGAGTIVAGVLVFGTALFLLVDAGFV